MQLGQYIVKTLENEPEECKGLFIIIVATFCPRHPERVEFAFHTSITDTLKSYTKCKKCHILVNCYVMQYGY